MELDLPTYNLDHTKPIYGYGNFSYKYIESESAIDTTIADKKRELWDYVIKNNLLNSKDKTLRAKAQSLLRDKTIFLYNFAKLNNLPVNLLNWVYRLPWQLH